MTCFKSSEYNCRVVHSPLGVLSDFDDVRSYERAASKAICRAIKAGSKSPLLILPSAKGKNSRFENADLCTLLGALQELYVVSGTYRRYFKLKLTNHHLICSQFNYVKMYRKNKNVLKF